MCVLKTMTSIVVRVLEGPLPIMFVFDMINGLDRLTL